VTQKDILKVPKHKAEVTKQPKIFSFFFFFYFKIVTLSWWFLHEAAAFYTVSEQCTTHPFFTTSKSHQGAWNHHMASHVHIYTNHLATKCNLYSMSVNLKYGQCTCMETKRGELAFRLSSIDLVLELMLRSVILQLILHERFFFCSIMHYP